MADGGAAPAPAAVLRGTVVLSASRAAIVAVHAVIHIAVGRLAAPESYGAFCTAFFLLSWVDTVTPALVLPGLLKIVSEDRRHLRPALGLAARWYLPAMAAVTLGFCLCVPWLARWFGDPLLLPLLALIGLQIPFMAAIRLGESLLIGLRRHGGAASIRLAYAVSTALAAAAFLGLGWGADGAMAAITGGTVPAATAALGLLLWAGRSAPAQEDHPEMRHRVAHWTAASVPAVAASRTLMTLDLWLVKALAAPPQAGLFAACYAISRLPMFAVFGLSSAVFPEVSAAAARGAGAVAQERAEVAMRALILLFAPVSVLLAACAEDVLGLLLGAAYVQAGPALRVLATATPLAAWFVLCCRLIGAADRPGLALALIASVLAVATGLHWRLISGWGMMGGAWASLLVFAAGATAATMIVRRLLAAAPPRATIVRALIAGAAAWAVAAAWPASGAMVLLEMGASVLVYGCLLVALGEVSPADLRRLLAGLARPGVSG